MCAFDDAFRRGWVGLENFRELFRNEAFLLEMRNTLFLTGITVPLHDVLDETAAKNLEKSRR
ncbi:MAG TPA: hypothetical protein DD727_00130 [Clostridiales bacterium]|nr:hypothetical protein [Clostridiales bacterium]